MDYFKNFYMSLGCYPPEYNRAVHGPFDAGRYYGKPDTNFWDLKLSELPAWLKRRRFDPYNIAYTIGRVRHRWVMKYQLPYRAKSTYILQTVALVTILCHVCAYKTAKKHKHYKYHW